MLDLLLKGIKKQPRLPRFMTFLVRVIGSGPGRPQATDQGRVVRFLQLLVEETEAKYGIMYSNMI